MILPIHRAGSRVEPVSESQLFNKKTIPMMGKALLSLIAFPVLFGTAQPAAPVHGDVPEVATYQIDPVHSELTFRIRHLLGRVRGTFTEWGGTIVVDPSNLSGGSVDVTIQTGSIHTLNADRDAHLRSPDFFAADEYPTITFRSERVVQKGDQLEVHGNLTIRGTARPVVLEGRYLGSVTDPWGAERIVFEATTTINRQDYGVSFNQAIEGMTVIGDDVEITIVVQAVRQ